MNRLKKIICWLCAIIIIILLLFPVLGIQKKLYQAIYPIHYETIVNQYAGDFKIDPYLVYAIIKIESNFNEKAESRSGAIGLMQLMEGTAKEQAKKMNMTFQKEMLYQPDINLKLGLRYFNKLLDYFNQNYVLAFAAYNAGLGNVQKWIKEGTIEADGSNIENIPFKETNLYVRKIIKTYKIYMELYNS